jgi:hypothetical protein
MKSANVITNETAQRAQEAFARDSSSISNQEKANVATGALELIDSTLVLKTEVAAGEEQDLLSIQKNKDVRTGVVDFQDGKIITQDGGGSIAVHAMKIAHAAGAANEDAAEKSYTQATFPTDLENAELQLSQGGRIIQRVKLSEFAFKGDEPQTREDQWKHFVRPFTIVAGADIKVKLLRPTGIAGAVAFLDIEFKGMQTFPKRTRG